MKGLAWYYVTRLGVVAVWLFIATIGGLPLWANVLPAAAMTAYFLWLPRSGYYVVREDQPLAPMRRDERTQLISNRAATWAFIAETVLLGLGVVWSALSGRGELGAVLGFVLAAGSFAYLVAHAWLARRG